MLFILEIIFWKTFVWDYVSIVLSVFFEVLAVSGSMTFAVGNRGILEFSAGMISYVCSLTHQMFEQDLGFPTFYSGCALFQNI